MKNWMIIALLLIGLLPLQAHPLPTTTQNDSVLIQGIAPDYAGQILSIYGYTYFGDGWSNTYPLLDKSLVGPDGHFSFRFPIDHTQKIFLPLGRLQGSLFVEAGHTYTISLPPWEPLTKADELNPYFQKEEILLSLQDLPKQDLNALIIDFEDAFDAVWIDLQQKGISPNSISKAIASLEEKCPSLNNTFFEEYKTYRYALLVNLYEKESPNRAIYTFFLKQPVLYHQPTYWEAFEVLFPQFSPISSLASNLPLMEAVILQKVAQGDLGLTYLNNLQTPESIQIAAGIRQDKQQLSIGSPIDLGQLINIEGDTLHWDDLQFQQAYLIFANSYLKESLSDLRYVEQKQAQYKDRCLFVLIFDKEELSKTQLTCKNSSHKTFIFSTSNNPQIRAIFEKANIPDYYLVDREKRLRQSPAPQPKDFVP